MDVRVGGRPFTTYYFDPSVAKPYLSPVRSAQGTVVTRGFPMTPDIAGEDHDEPHQRAMYFAHGDINGFDFWGEAAFSKWSDHPVSTFGRTVFRASTRSGRCRRRKSSGHVRPRGADRRHRRGDSNIPTSRGDEQSRTIDCEFVIRATHGPIVMGDTKERDVCDPCREGAGLPAGRMVNASGAVGEKGHLGQTFELGRLLRPRGRTRMSALRSSTTPIT